MLPATPSLPLAPTPAGHSTAVPEPTLVFFLIIGLRQIVGEVERGPRTVGTAHHSDGRGRQLQLGVQLRDRRVIPLGNLAKITASQSRAVEHEFTRLDA